jgi:hypothetical protein
LVQYHFQTIQPSPLQHQHYHQRVVTVYLPSRCCEYEFYLYHLSKKCRRPLTIIVDGLCVGPKFDVKTADRFTFNTSYNDGPSQTDKQGKLASTLQAGTLLVPQTLDLVPSWSSNVAVPIFYPGDSGGILVKFDSRNKLAITGWADDTISPINIGSQRDYYRWFACNTYYGYRYFTLAWVLGNKPPQNPSCQKVDVVRVFLPVEKAA